MPSIVTHKFRQFNADQFYESLSEAGPSYLYMAIGRIRGWADDNNPPSPSDAFANTEYGFWRDMLSAKRVTSADSSYVIPRNNWTTGVVYQEYSDTVADLVTSGNGHYVMTTDYHVYKCLFNSNGSQSTVQPTGTSASIFTTGDAYKWKYMYTISAASALKFVTDGYIPVQHIGAGDDGSNQWDVEQASANGSIDIIDVLTGGSSLSGYYVNGNIISAASGASMVLGTSSAFDDAYNGSTLYISGGTGAGLQSNVINYVASSNTITLSPALATVPDGTSTFEVAPRTVIVGDGTGAEAVAQMNTTSHTVHSVKVTQNGSNYSRATVTMAANTAWTTAATAVVYIPPPGGHGNNAIIELGGHNVLINAQFDKEESGKFTVSNDFRKINLVRDPLTFAGASATAATYDQTHSITFTSPSGAFSADELVTGGTSSANGNIVEANTTVMKLTNVQGTFAVAETITGGTSTETATTSVVGDPELRAYTGELLYSEYRSPISRAADQVEDVKLVINF